MLLGQTLYTTPAEIYRALIEATAFGALTIINRFEEYGVKVEQIVNCGGIAEKNPARYANLRRRDGTSHEGLAFSADVCAWFSDCGCGGCRCPRDYAEAQAAMTSVKKRVFMPNPRAHAVYRELYLLYRTLHDAFGTRAWNGNLHDVMKKLLEIRTRVRH